MWAGGAACASPARLVSSNNHLRIFTARICTVSSFNAHRAVLDDEPAMEEPAHRARIDHMLLLQNTRSERLRRVVVAYRHRRLDDYRPMVEIGGEEKHRAGQGVCPRLPRAPVGGGDPGHGGQRRERVLEDD